MDTSTKRAIRNIDRRVDRIMARMLRLERIDRMSTASWQRAWDKHPDLYQRVNALYAERGRLQNL
jgi:hypothetical protein